MGSGDSGETPVYNEEQEVGRVTIADSGELEFRYGASWLRAKDSFPLSVTMPLGLDGFGDGVVAPWLANLLPEGDLLVAVARALGIAPSDALSILQAIGGDTAGAISLSSPSVRSKWKYIPLTDWYGGTEEEALERHIQDVERKPFFAGEEDVRISLAGGQQKSVLAVLDEDGAPCLEFPGPGRRLAIPAFGAPSTIVIKPNNPHLIGDVEAEAYCLELARIVGIPVAKAGILRVSNRNALAVIRYDRLKMPDGSIKRLHQEDFAQANGIFPAQKYERGLLRGLDMERLLSTRIHLPPVERLRLLDQLIYRILVADTDAHAKNYSLSFERKTKLAPMYDTASVLLWDHVDQYFAQNIGRRKRKPQDVAQRHWIWIADMAGLNSTAMLNRVRKLANSIVRYRRDAVDIIAAQSGVSQSAIEHISGLVSNNALRIAGRIGA